LTALNPSILIVAEHALVRAGLRTLIGTTADFSVVAEASGLESAVQVAAEVRPDVVLLDPPRNHSDESMARLRAAAPSACVLCLTGDRRLSAENVRCIPPEVDVGEFCSTVASLLGDRCDVCQLRAICPVPREAVTLSPRERQVAIHVAAGLASKQIAAVLGIGLRTVNTYRESLRRKLGASSAAALTRYVLEHGLDTSASRLLPVVPER